jgi:hypothetical protein
MDDSRIHGTIEQLVTEEHELWEREAAGKASDADRRRLRELRLSLDQCWDLLRQRRALREAGRDPRMLVPVAIYLAVNAGRPSAHGSLPPPLRDLHRPARGRTPAR